MGSTFLTAYHPISTMLLVEINAFIFIAVFVIAKIFSLFQAFTEIVNFEWRQYSLLFSDILKEKSFLAFVRDLHFSLILFSEVEHKIPESQLILFRLFLLSFFLFIFPFPEVGGSVRLSFDLYIVKKSDIFKLMLW